MEHAFYWGTYDQAKRASALGVDQEQGGDGEDDLDGTIAK